MFIFLIGRPRGATSTTLHARPLSRGLSACISAAFSGRISSKFGSGWLYIYRDIRNLVKIGLKN